MENRKPKSKNIATAIYIAKNHGNNISDEQLINVAKGMNLKPKVLIRNYNRIATLNKILENLNRL